MIVADTSVLLKFVIPEPRSDIAGQLRNERLIAPDIWIAEAANALWRRSITGSFSKGKAEELLTLMLSGAVTTVPSENEIEAALQIALALNHPVYDCLFLALAIRHNSYVITDDARFAVAVRKHGKWAAHVKSLRELG